MKKITFLLLLSLSIFFHIKAQNIPHANAVGPFGVEVNTYNGNLFFNRTDLVIPNNGVNIDLTFAYNSFRDSIDYGYGKGWTFMYNLHYFEDSTGIVVEQADGRQDFFDFIDNEYVAPKGIFTTFQQYDSDKFRLTTKYGMTYYFENANHKKLTKLEDNNGNFINIAYSNGYPSQITDQSNRTIAMIWNGDHLQQVTDANLAGSRTVIYEYDATGHLTKVTDPEGGEIQYSYNAVFLQSILNERGNFLDIFYNEQGKVRELISCVTKMKFQYNTNQNRTHAVEKNAFGDRMTTFVYNEEGLLLSKNGNCCGYGTDYIYDEDLNVSQTTDANGNVVSTNHDAVGNPLFVTDANGATANFEFSANNYLTSFTDKKGNTTTFERAANGNLTSLQQPLGVSLDFLYDNIGNVTQSTDGLGSATNYSYNPNNDLTTIAYPAGNSESFSYDAVGNLIAYTDGAGNSVYYEYDKLNRVTKIWDDLGQEMLFGYDEASNLTQETSANGHVKLYGFDSRNRIETITTQQGEMTYRYDESGNIISIIDYNNNERTFAYDTRNIMVSETDAEGNTTLYDHDGNGNVIAKTDANGNVTEYKYDALNRLIEKKYLGNTDLYEYDLNGNMIFSANNNISISYAYDALNRLISKTFLNWNQTIAYEYDAANNRTKMTDMTGETLYGYDLNNRLTSITNPAGATTTFVYDNANRMTEQHHANGTISYYTYDNADRLLSLFNRKSDETLLSYFEYEYDANGNRTKITSQNGIRTYEYDSDDRLTKVFENSNLLEDYELDGAGNRLGLNGNITYNYDNADRLISAGSSNYEFDKNGNLIAKNQNGAVVNYEYDGADRLIKVTAADGTITEFQYDPFGNRLSKNADGNYTRYLLDGENILLELNENNALQARYTTGLTLDSWISMNRNDNQYCYHTDGLNSIVQLTDADEMVKNNYQYGTYGSLSGSTTVNNSILYTGREWDGSIGLYYYRSRFYDAEIGRFITKDKFDGIQDIPVSQNKYLYVKGNPITLNDPTGEFFFIPFAIPVLKAAVAAFAGSVVLGTVESVIDQIGDLESVDGKVDCGKAIVDGFDSAISELWNPAKKIKKGVNQVKKGVKVIFKKKKWKKGLKKVKKGAKNYAEGKVKKSGYDYAKEKITEAVSFNCNPFSGGSQEEEKENTPPTPEVPTPGNPGKVTVPIVGSVDPNEIISPLGYGQQKWVARDATLNYTINFENDPEFATAAAQIVRIEHKFSENLNRFSFELKSFGFGDYFFTVPDNLSYYNTQIDLTDSLGILLQVTAGLNAADSTAFWVFESRDPETNLVTSLPANLGFLPINDTLLHNGEGFVNFAIRPRADTQTGDLIEAQASIIFDDNPAIATNIDFNTIDADAPVTSIHTHDEQNGVHTLEWSGTDSLNQVMGSGLATYALYLSINDGVFLPLEDNLTVTNYEFVGSPDSSYCFFVLGTDFVNNEEAQKLNCEPACMDVSVAAIEPADLGENNGSIELEVNNYEGNISFQWSHDDNLTTSFADNLAAGNYSVTVSDDSGCVIISTFTIDLLNNIFEPTTETDLFIHRMYPVPTTDKVTIDFSAASSIVFVEIYDMVGRKVFAKTINRESEGVQSLPIDVTNYAAGNYVVRIRDRMQQTNAVFTKQ